MGFSTKTLSRSEQACQNCRLLIPQRRRLSEMDDLTFPHLSQPGLGLTLRASGWPIRNGARRGAMIT
ncbi:hypothetical protein CXG50_07150 [Pseudomonas plecoglossicida]|jgi:hypothetical protein|uniref:Uncharacterized protein n=2 Tax=Pseudomonas TaxID=286 RepID=A0AAX0VQY0_9PSED|nr:hypothetical protein B479_13755 [Pseudomonas putida HB3267]PLP93008.1 hypothetical protein CX682_08500 [Pseudomonas sp. FFUP_PS_41]PLV00168.1 hypothetical protein CXG52_04440 [Pseudomonas plecoglossicida]PLV14767.1 hypothetical protein CXG49_22895 [Pseudomonas guariconensis]TXI02221.1 MAG: hypothetical protein E6Q70_18600 [Pseudomonas monteilii]GLO32179.1 hypothetical protein PPUN12996_42380 [Pseudomonas putida]